MNTFEHWSRLPGFFSLSLQERRAVLLELSLGLFSEDFGSLDKGLSLVDADRMCENVIAIFDLPLCVAVNFIVDDIPVLVPMVTEEASIVAAASKMAKLVGKNGGFFTNIDKSLVKGQIQIYDVMDVDKAIKEFLAHKESLLAFAKTFCASMEKRGGGIEDIGIRVIPSAKIGPMLVIEPIIDVVDVMGANTVNTLVEKLATKVSSVISGTVGIKILSNLCDQRLARARCEISLKTLASVIGDRAPETIARRMIAAHAFAEADIYRACTHNKGILNGIDAVAMATGNDFRAIEASAHAFASLASSYRPLTSLTLIEETLCAELSLPLAVGVAGGHVHMHPGVKFAHKLLGKFAHSARGLSSVMVSVGLAQCLAAVLALADEGIQRGHMKLHTRKISS